MSQVLTEIVFKIEFIIFAYKILNFPPQQTTYAQNSQLRQENSI